MKYKIKVTSQFKKDLKLAMRQQRDMNKLWEIVDMLANGQDLEPKYKDHKLSGDYETFRECHISPDWLLIYKKQDNVLLLVLSRTGSHSDLFY